MFACLHAPGLPDSSYALLVNCACGFSPRVEETDASSVLLDIEGLDRLLGPPEKIANAMARRAAGLGMRVNIAVAANPDAAVHAARGFSGITILPQGKEGYALAGLPLALLSPPPEMAETLESWGIRNFGDLAALPEAGLAARLGPEGVRLQKLARGAGNRLLSVAIPDESFAASLELEHPVSLLEPISFLLARLLGEVLDKLAQGLATDELRLRMRLDRTGLISEEHQQAEASIDAAPIPEEHMRTLRLPFPMRSAKTFLKLLALDLESHPPPAPVTAISLAAVAVDPRVVQYGLFLPPAPEPEKLELTLGRITKMVGKENVGAAQLLDTHRPGAFHLKPFAIPETPTNNRARASIDAVPASTGSAFLGLRVFRPPLRAEVEAPSGLPSRITARGVRGAVLSMAGPWRNSGEWWTDDAWSRDEWDVVLSDGSIYRIYRDYQEDAWFVEGSYD